MHKMARARTWQVGKRWSVSDGGVTLIILLFAPQHVLLFGMLYELTYRPRRLLTPHRGLTCSETYRDSLVEWV